MAHLVYEIHISDLAKLDSRWNLLWDHFVSSCTKPSENNVLLPSESEYLRAKFEPPRPAVDTLRELAYKMKHFIQKPGGRGVGNQREEWLSSNGKYLRNPGEHVNVGMVVTILCSILADNTILQRGNFYYPAGAFREWHTNQFDPLGWRMYFVHTVPNSCGTFRYRKPATKEVITCADKDGCIRLFRIENGKSALWHSITSDGDRWSLGFLLSNSSAAKLISMAEL